MSPSGVHVPPVMLFHRKNMNARLMKGAPSGAKGYASANGWMDNALFLKYLEHFIDFVRPCTENKILVILDGHQSHKSLQVIDMARANHITIITLPPHTSHRLQPLDITFFGPLKSNYNKEIDRWMLNNPGKRVTDYDISEIFAPAYLKTVSAEKAANGFRVAGIYPFNPDVFQEEDFAASLTTEQPAQSELPETSQFVSMHGAVLHSRNPNIQRHHV